MHAVCPSPSPVMQHSMPNNEDPQLPAVRLPEFVVEELREAKRVLEHRGVADQLTELVGMPITASLKALPDAVERAAYAAVNKSLEAALDVATKSLGYGRCRRRFAR